MSKIATAERVSREPSDNFVYQRSRLAYHFAAERVSGRVLEVGTGTGYGVDIIAPKAEKFISIDKFPPQFESGTLPQNVEIKKAVAPPLPFEDESFDSFVSFQVIEHIERDEAFVAEIYRVLKPDGVAIISTPNAPMSLTRNPWHVREYTADEFSELLSRKFESVEPYGVVGNERVMEYFNKNRESVKRLIRLDIFDLQHRLPRWMLQIPYDILNRINRRKLLKQNSQLTSSIKMEDYSVRPICSEAFDLIYVAKKCEKSCEFNIL
ncbi:MAG: methyltransferase domain-containing protein [Rikenellaceae bacterium]